MNGITLMFSGVAGAMTRLLALAIFCCASYASAQSQDRETQWDLLVASAKEEGKVVLLGPPDSQVRQELSAAFKARFGVTLEYLGSRSSESSARLRIERGAGLYTVDVVFAGSDTLAGAYYPERMLAPLKPALILPDALDPDKWRRGKLWFTDPEERYVLRLFNTVGPALYVNTRHVKAEDIRAARDLLDPRWQGRISAHDPTVGGSGVGHATRFYLQFGEDFLRRLYVDQKPAVARDRRQLTDWLLRGSYPVSLDAEEDQVERLRREGLPIRAVYKLSDMPGTLSAGVGQMALFDRAPHPNAAKLFANWMASKEGLEIYARARGEAPTRSDIDALAFLPAELVPQAGATYFDMHGWESGVVERQKVQALMKEMLKSRGNN
jgi:iron(III) transport system substrate-binding protein